MTHSALWWQGAKMRTASIALVCCLGAATVAVAAEPAPAYDLPPFPGSPPAAPKPATALPADVRPYAPAHTHAETARPPHGRTCFTQSEAREKIAQRRLTDPVSATRAGRAEGDALRTRLCRWRQDEWIYEVYVLRRDGRIVRLYIDAQNGRAVGAPDGPEHK